MPETTTEIEEREERMQVAKTILEQLGGVMFLRMTGAKNLLGGDNFLAFHLPPCDYKKDGITKVKITLTSMDDYKLEFWKKPNFRRPESLVPFKVIDDVYCDQLRSIFTDVTGLLTGLSERVRTVK